MSGFPFFLPNATRLEFAAIFVEPRTLPQDTLAKTARYQLQQLNEPPKGSRPTNEATMIEIDHAKNVLQVHRVDAAGKTVIRKQLRRRHVPPFFRMQPPCPIGKEV